MKVGGAAHYTSKNTMLPKTPPFSKYRKLALVLGRVSSPPHTPSGFSIGVWSVGGDSPPTGGFLKF